MEENNTKNMLVILPTYNESGNIIKIVDAIQSLNLAISILIVDDNSPDGTGKIADELAKNYKNIFIIHRKKKLGLGSAYVAGFKFGLENNFDYICEMDADFSHDPKYLLDFYRSLEKYDLVTGSRYISGISIVNWSMSRLLLSYLGNKFVKLITGMPFTDCTGGFKCFRAEAVKAIDLNNIIAKSYAFQMEMLYRSYKKSLRIKEIPIIFYNREYGKSKMNGKEFFLSFLIVLYLRFTSGLKKS